MCVVNCCSEHYQIHVYVALSFCWHSQSIIRSIYAVQLGLLLINVRLSARFLDVYYVFNIDCMCI